MDVSIIISTHNRASKIGDTLASLVKTASTANAKWELLVMDNQSSDSTREIVESYRTHGIPNLYYQYKKRGGKTTSLNLGIGRAKGRIVALLDDDVVVDPGWMSSLIAEYDKDPSVVAVGGRVELYNVKDSALSIRTSPNRISVSRATFDPTAVPVTGCNMSFARRVFDEVGRFDDLLGPGNPIPAAEDLDMLWRVCRKGHAINYTPTVLVLHNHGRQSAQEAAESAYSYVFGRGAFYAKYTLRFDELIFKRGYYEMRHVIRSWMHTNPNWPTAISPAAYFRALTWGALSWCWHSLCRPFRFSYPYDSPADQ